MPTILHFSYKAESLYSMLESGLAVGLSLAIETLAHVMQSSTWKELAHWAYLFASLVILLLDEHA